jgi:hypothetical protein
MTMSCAFYRELAFPIGKNVYSVQLPKIKNIENAQSYQFENTAARYVILSAEVHFNSPLRGLSALVFRVF